MAKKAPLYVKAIWIKNEENNSKKDNLILLKIIRTGFKIIKTILKILKNSTLFYYVVYGITAVLAVYYHPFLYAFHLSEILMRFPTLRNVIRAVWGPKFSLFLTLTLCVLVVYFNAVIAYLSFYEYYEGRCENLYICLVETFDQIFKVISFIFEIMKYKL